MYHFYNKGEDENIEYCFNVEAKEPLNDDEIKILKKLITNNLLSDIKNESQFNENNEIIELGPLLNFATASSTNSINICHACGLDKIIRIEKSRRHLATSEIDKQKFIDENHDRMTECQYLEKLKDFKLNIQPEPVVNVPLIEQGISALQEINKKMGLGMDDWDEKLYYDLFVNKIKRNPTNVECFQLGQANSEHSRHWFFKGKLIIDGKEMPETLLEIIFSTLEANPNNSLIAFKDNSSALRGYEINTIIPKNPGQTSAFKKERKTYHIIFTAETHNFPTGVAPFPGAETGTGGRIRDGQATGRGSLVVASTVAYCVGNLNIPGYDLPWEDKTFIYPTNFATPLKIEMEASNGASDYGNKFGEPLIQGYTRSFGLTLPNGERQEWIKPIMFAGGVGQIDNEHIKKGKPEPGMLIIQVGGPAYRIGTGGGAASSMIQGENIAELDFNAVQRGDAEMEQKMNRIIRACVEMGKDNPMISIHDQGAGGPCNVLTEIVEPIGGRIEIRDINLGDETMSVLEIWGAEYQERNALLIKPASLEQFKEICAREKCYYEMLGEITGDGKIVVHDSNDDSTPVNLELEKILGKMPQKTFTDKNIHLPLESLKLPTDLTIKQALEKVLRLLSVGSKRFLTSKVDRSVTGLIAQQQCVGPLQLTLADVAVIAQSHFGKSGVAISIGEQPIKMIINPEAGARMAIGEALTNMVWARISDLTDIKCSGNWMWAAKLPGEAARIYKAATATRAMMTQLGIAIDGGKDSLSMATKIGDQIVKSPGELTVSAYATMPDINKVITPDIKEPGKSNLWIIDLGDNNYRMGGSSLAQVFKQVGNESPDVANVDMLKNLFNAVQTMIDKEIILSGHDRSDGGLITTLLEMAFAGNAGFEINYQNLRVHPIAYYFNEELGLVIEINPANEVEFLNIINKYKLSEVTSKLGSTTKEQIVRIKNNEEILLEEDMKELRAMWEETSFELEKLQTNTAMAVEEKKNVYAQAEPKYNLTFTPALTSAEILAKENKPKVAILREEGSNGDREMTSAFYQAGFEVWDVMMTDLLTEKINLDDFRGLVFVGGFSYADVLGSAKGWASTIKFNKKLKEMFDNFYNRPDTFSLGVCNGCQLMAHLGWVSSQEISEEKQPRFIKNKSGRFESRWVTVKIMESPSIMLQGMAGSVLGTWTAHGEGQLSLTDDVLTEVREKKLAPLVYLDDNGEETEKYPFNPNGSINGITSLCSANGRHLAMMPHPERLFLKWQWPWMPKDWQKDLKASPWLRMFQNAFKWCEENKKGHSGE